VDFAAGLEVTGLRVTGLGVGNDFVPFEDFDI
jgi:hypothetical protein